MPYPRTWWLVASATSIQITVTVSVVDTYRSRP